MSGAFVPKSGTLMQSTLRTFSPTDEPDTRGSHVNSGARPLLAPPLLGVSGPTTSGVPKYACDTPGPAASPENLKCIGTPLVRVEMPDNCQPFSRAPKTA